MESLLNPEVAMHAVELNHAFANGKPFKHVVINDFLKPEVAEGLLREFPCVEEPSKLLNEFGRPNPKSAISNVRAISATFREMDAYIQSSDFLETMSRITGIADLHYDPWYFGAGTHENFHGAGLDPHYDFNIHPKTAQHRRLNAIVYLNKEWDPAWRGDISFHSNPWDLQHDEKISIAPTFNRCVIFETTENSWHSVTPVSLPDHLRNRSRKSFTIYLYTDTRAAEETAPEHGTVYVQVGLSKHIQAGHVLTQEDMREINLNMDRRQQYLRALYEREYAFSSHIADLRRQIDELRRNSDCRVYGWFILREVIKPLYVDGWASDELEFRVTLAQRVSTIRTLLWIPENAGLSIDVVFSVNSESASVKMTGGHATLSLKVPLEPGSNARISLKASPTRRSSDLDERMISLVVDHFELIE